MKRWIILTGLVFVLLFVSNVSAAAIDQKVYDGLAPCYTDYLIKAYGPVPTFDKDHNVVSMGITSNFSTFVDRDSWYKKMSQLYENTKVPVDKQFMYPRGPVLSYGWDALGSVFIGVYDKAEVNPETINEIYSYVNAEAKKEGIDNVPVVFFTSPMIQLDLGRTDVWRPVIGGVQDGNSIGGLTVGFAMYRGGQMGFATAGHIGNVGTTVYQPNTAYPVGTVTVSSLGRNSDSAWIQYANSAGQVFESSTSQPGVSGSTDPWQGLGIYKSGVSTGVTSGTALSTTSAYNSFFGTTLYNQWFGTYTATSGDSGAPVYFKDANQQIQIVGLHWGNARYSVFSPISSVLSDLS